MHVFADIHSVTKTILNVKRLFSLLAMRYGLLI